MRSMIVRALRWLQVDHAVVFLAASRGWSFLAGPVNIVLLTAFLSPQAQGYYYTFSSLVALQSFVELGFYTVILQFASHEWARLSLAEDGAVTGDAVARARLASLVRFAARWYAAVALLFVLAVFPAGYAFLARGGVEPGEWAGPWAALVLATAVQLWLLPFLSVLEGCGFVRAVNGTRLLQSMCTSMAVWCALALGGGLWALPAAIAVSALLGALLVGVRFRRFFLPLWRGPLEARIHWRRELWPMQWRLAGSGMVNYLAFSMFVPVVFHFHGAVAAGRLGLTYQMAAAVGGIAQAWITPRVPAFGVLIARRAYTELDRLFFRTSAVAVAMAVLGGIALVAIVSGLGIWLPRFAGRMAAPEVALLLAAAFAALQVSQCQSAYLRAHRREVLLPLSILVASTTAILTLVLGARYAEVGAALAFFLSNAIVLVPLETVLWARRRREWHAPAASPGIGTV